MDEWYIYLLLTELIHERHQKQVKEKTRQLREWLTKIITGKNLDDEQKPWGWEPTTRKQETQRQSPSQHMFYSPSSVFLNLLLMSYSFLCVVKEVTSHFKWGYMILIECSNYMTCKKETHLFCHQYMWHVTRTSGALRWEFSHL